MCEFVFKGNPLVMDSAKYALYANCLEDINIPLLNPGSMFLFKRDAMSLKSKDKSSLTSSASPYVNPSVSEGFPIDE